MRIGKKKLRGYLRAADMVDLFGPAPDQSDYSDFVQRYVELDIDPIGDIEGPDDAFALPDPPVTIPFINVGVTPSVLNGLRGTLKNTGMVKIPPNGPTLSIKKIAQYSREAPKSLKGFFRCKELWITG